jgi:hypothetical protein
MCYAMLYIHNKSYTGKSYLVKELVEYYSKHTLNSNNDNNTANANGSTKHEHIASTVKYNQNNSAPLSTDISTSSSKGKHPLAIVCSADTYFIDPQTGQYNYRPECISEAHQYSQNQFLDALNANIPLIVVDNTNMSKWHYEFYVKTIQQGNDTYNNGNTGKQLNVSANYQNNNNVDENGNEIQHTSDAAVNETASPFSHYRLVILDIRLPNIKQLSGGVLNHIDVCEYRNNHGVERDGLFQMMDNYQADRNAVQVISYIDAESLRDIYKWKQQRRREYNEQQRQQQQVFQYTNGNNTNINSTAAYSNNGRYNGRNNQLTYIAQSTPQQLLIPMQAISQLPSQPSRQNRHVKFI